MGIFSIEIENYKSIRKSGEILLKPINVLIGPNGAGKSNFISFFKFLKWIYDQNLKFNVGKEGRADNFLYFGTKTSSYLSGEIIFDNENLNQYKFRMVPDFAFELIFNEEVVSFLKPEKYPGIVLSSAGRSESDLKNFKGVQENPIEPWEKHYVQIKPLIADLKVFHFHDTSFNSSLKQPSNTTDYAFLQENGGNIASFLFRLQHTHEKHFRMIEKIIQSIAPFFQSFFLMPDEINSAQIYLRWYEKGSNQLFSAYNMSDGTLRMICLITLLMQPEPPGTIIIDEPELGLHPFAIGKLAAMLQSVSVKSQIIISTQSVSLINEFNPEDIIVVEREDRQTVFKRQSSESLAAWLQDYSLGELWEKNILGGRP